MTIILIFLTIKSNIYFSGFAAGCTTLMALLNGICASTMRRLITFSKLFHVLFAIPAFILSTLAFIYGLIQRSDDKYILDVLSESSSESNPSNTISTAVQSSIAVVTQSWTTTTSSTIIDMKRSYLISYILISCCSFYTIGIICLPIIGIFHSWAKEVF